ncbi:MAG: sulfatase [Rhodopirellula sp. JB044]|uniref:sulfatase n=1 Tax=Rhodopirellula sp. JB044 TaxID=3342844 RepID=UPI00370B41C9
MNRIQMDHSSVRGQRVPGQEATQQVMGVGCRRVVAPLRLWLLVLLVFLMVEQTQGERPNVLLILVDDMGWKDMGCAGSTYYETPHLDRMAADGVRFVNGYSASVVCTPSRGALFSGKYPARTKLTNVFHGPSGPDDRLYDTSKYSGTNHRALEARNRHALPIPEVIFAEAFVDGGYRTGFFGKWHIGECPNYYPDDRGFQVAKGYRVQAAGTGKSGHWMKTFKDYGANMEGVDPEAYLADVLTDQCIDFITENKDRPFLAVLSHYLAHAPIDPKPEKVGHYQNKPATDQNNPRYAAVIESIDESVGRLSAVLQELGLEEKTLVLFTSDNGGWTPHATSNYPLMGGKSFPFEAGTRVPFIVKWSGRIKPRISQERVISMDLYPTMLAAAGLPQRPQQHVDGVNLIPHLTKGRELKRRPLVLHFPHYTHATGPYSAIILDGWKLIRFYNDETGGCLLYNLKDDPYEQKDLAATTPERLAALNHRLDLALKGMSAEMPRRNPARKKTSPGMNLSSVKELAEKERAVFETRLSK